MQAKTIVKNQSTEIALERYTTNSVTSKDGTRIGYRQFGHGLGVVLLHGAMESAHSHMQLAGFLADTFTVYLPDRRGRGLSGPFGPDHSIRKEVEDLDALLSKTGTRHVFGVSAGGLICLQAALLLPAIRKMVLYEPVLSVSGSVSTAFLARYDQEIAQGRLASALVSGMLGAQMGPAVFNALPRWLLELITTLAMNAEDKKAQAGDVTMRLLAPTLHYDFQLVVEMSQALESFKAVPAEVLLLGGSASPAYLKLALNAIEKALPHARRIEFPGFNHGASGNTDRGGQPERVAQELRNFFA